MNKFNLIEKTKLNNLIETERGRVWNKLRLINNKQTWFKEIKQSKEQYEQDLLLLNKIKDKINN